MRTTAVYFDSCDPEAFQTPRPVSPSVTKPVPAISPDGRVSDHFLQPNIDVQSPDDDLAQIRFGYYGHSFSVMLNEFECAELIAKIAERFPNALPPVPVAQTTQVQTCGDCGSLQYAGAECDVCKDVSESEEVYAK